MRILYRPILYLWAAPATGVGMLLALLAWCGGARLTAKDGVLEAVGGRVTPLLLTPAPRHRYVAVTLGHVIVARDAQALEGCRCHEHAHVRQYERWGILFFPLYLGSSALQWLRGGRPYWDNYFERQARAEAGERQT